MGKEIDGENELVCAMQQPKLPVALALDREIKRSFQKTIATAVGTYKVKKDLIFNFDHTPLAFISPGSYTMALKGGKKSLYKMKTVKGALLEQLLLLLPVLLYPSS